VTRHLAAVVAIALAAPAGAAAATDREAARAGASWLEMLSIGPVGQQADVIVALAATGRPGAALRGRLARITPTASSYAGTAGAAGKVVLATVAAGRNPRSLGGVNYVARIRAQYAGGRYGVSAYDQAYAILALRAAGEPVPRGAITALRNTRGRGGWGFALTRSGRDDVSATGLLIEATRSAGVLASDPMLRQATAWLLVQRNASGGFHIGGAGKATEANSTAIAIRALRAMGRTPSASTRLALRSLQEPDGGFRFTREVRESRLFATVDAVLALSGRRLPPPFVSGA
jgi:hypothetical protein